MKPYIQKSARRSLDAWFEPFRGHRMFTTEQHPFAVTVGTHYGALPVVALRYFQLRGWVKIVSTRQTRSRTTITTWRVTKED